MAEETCCGCVTLDGDTEYDMGLHIGSIFIIFVVSAAGTMIPIISQKIPQCKANSVIMEAVSAFAYGVVLATGLIHMINEGIEKLSNECLGSVVENYESLGLAFVLITLVLMHFIECESSVFFGAQGSMLHGHGHAHGEITAQEASERAQEDSIHVADSPNKYENVSRFNASTISARSGNFGKGAEVGRSVAQIYEPTLQERAHTLLAGPYGLALEIINFALSMLIFFAYIAELYDKDIYYSHSRFAVEVIATSFFIFDFGLHLFVANDPWKYVFSGHGMIDLVTIIPSLIVFVDPGTRSNLMFVFRVLRIFRILRVLRLARYIRFKKHGFEYEYAKRRKWDKGWIHEYLDGLTYQVFPIMFSSRFDNRKFGVVARHIYEKYGALLIATFSRSGCEGMHGGTVYLAPFDSIISEG
ncbi:hypothetical protein AM588_10011368 [Phytophthora nicotianae]|uniref:Uncharacterized protein n=1 Tax=Phytophthora nicotianae TaxID=4792 RepID=A0A0W8DLV1_PHYNI|nr:hypothetical protein AM588_10011368 [Phytophthora nicotianae]